MHSYNIINFNTIDSTSVFARKNLDALNDFDIICANCQSAGHGQFERKWFSSSANGGNAYFSMVLKPKNIDHLNELTRFASSIISLTLSEYGLKSDFKFPNDVLINGKKISGTLAESVFVGTEFKGVVVGIGINLNLSLDDAKNIDIPATSIFIETKKQVNKDEFMKRFLTCFIENYDDFLINGLKEELSYSV